MDFTSPPASQASQLFLYSVERRPDSLTGWATVRHVSSQTQVPGTLVSDRVNVHVSDDGDVLHHVLLSDHRARHALSPVESGACSLARSDSVIARYDLVGFVVLPMTHGVSGEVILRLRVSPGLSAAGSESALLR